MALILEAHPDPKRHADHQGFAVVVSTLEDELHALDKDEAAQDREIGSRHRARNGHQYGHQLG